MSTSLSDTPVRPGRLREVATPREDLVTVLLGACLVGGAMADGWAHSNVIDTLEGFFTPWHALLYGGFAGTAAWICWLAYRRRDRAPYWWRDAWPSGYRLGAIGVLLFLAGGLGDMVWHETIGIEVGLNAAFSPTHMLIDAGALLMLTSPLRSWWAAGAGGGLRAATGVASMTLAPMGATILLTHSVAFAMAAPTEPYQAVSNGGVGRLEHIVAVRGVDAYLLTTLLLLVPLLLAHRRRATPGAATAVVGGVALFTMVMIEFPAPLAAAALAAVGAAAVADLILVRLDALRGTDAPLRLPIAGAVFAAVVWSGHLLGLHLAEGVRWPVEMWTGLVVLCAVLGALLGGLAARPSWVSEDARL